MHSREEPPVKAKKAMGVAIAVQICVKVLAAVAGKHILRRKHNMNQHPLWPYERG